MYKNNRGAALLQVLMLSALLAGLAVMVLRVTLSRQVTARQVRHSVGVRMAVSSCIAQINEMWAVMTPAQYEQSLNSCSMPPYHGNNCDGGAAVAGEWYCRVQPFNQQVCVTARMRAKLPEDSTDSPCRIDFTVKDGVPNL